MVTIAKHATGKGGALQRTLETISRDWVHKVSPWHLSKIPAQLSWPVAQRYKSTVGWQLPRSTWPVPTHPQDWVLTVPAITLLTRPVAATAEVVTQMLRDHNDPDDSESQGPEKTADVTQESHDPAKDDNALDMEHMGDIPGA